MDISELKVGDIVVCGEAPYRQLFYIHKTSDAMLKIVASGVQEGTQCGFLEKWEGWIFDRKATEEEERRFYQLIEERGYKFNRNTGVSRH